jgi:hexokinase
MNVTWVHSLPTGKETGTFLTLDLGGTNLRVCKVTLQGESGKDPNQKYDLEQEQYKFPETIKATSADELWTHVAEKLEDFIHNKGLRKEYNDKNKLPLGFCFSYPATQERIDHAVLQTWTKGFDIDGVEGHDAAAQLRAKIEEKELPLDLICVINDTVGAMVASAYSDPATIIGGIFGTGCNAAYMSSVSSIKKLSPNDERLKDKDGNIRGRMAINCEYGAFDNARRVLPWTKYDAQIDVESPRPGQQTFEKLSAGLYLGEIFRLILAELTDQGLVFTSQRKTSNGKLRERNSIDTSLLSQIESDDSKGFADTRDMFKDVLGLDLSDQELEVSRRVAELIAVRGARLCACGVAAICLKEGIKEGHVAADGSVANKHPYFKKRWATALAQILGFEGQGEDQNPIIITSADDGSGVGCAIIAAMELENRMQHKPA